MMKQTNNPAKGGGFDYSAPTLEELRVVVECGFIGSDLESTDTPGSGYGDHDNGDDY